MKRVTALISILAVLAIFTASCADSKPSVIETSPATTAPITESTPVTDRPISFTSKELMQRIRTAKQMTVRIDTVIAGTKGTLVLKKNDTLVRCFMTKDSPMSDGRQKIEYYEFRGGVCFTSDGVQYIPNAIEQSWDEFCMAVMTMSAAHLAFEDEGCYEPIANGYALTDEGEKQILEKYKAKGSELSATALLRDGKYEIRCSTVGGSFSDTATVTTVSFDPVSIAVPDRAEDPLAEEGFEITPSVTEPLETEPLETEPPLPPGPSFRYWPSDYREMCLEDYSDVIGVLTKGDQTVLRIEVDDGLIRLWQMTDRGEQTVIYPSNLDYSLYLVDGKWVAEKNVDSWGLTYCIQMEHLTETVLNDAFYGIFALNDHLFAFDVENDRIYVKSPLTLADYGLKELYFYGSLEDHVFCYEGKAADGTPFLFRFDASSDVSLTLPEHEPPREEEPTILPEMLPSYLASRLDAVERWQINADVRRNGFLMTMTTVLDGELAMHHVNIFDGELIMTEYADLARGVVYQQIDGGWYSDSSDEPADQSRAGLIEAIGQLCGGGLFPDETMFVLKDAVTLWLDDSEAGRYGLADLYYSADAANGVYVYTVRLSDPRTDIILTFTENGGEEVNLPSAEPKPERIPNKDPLVLMTPSELLAVLENAGSAEIITEAQGLVNRYTKVGKWIEAEVDTGNGAMTVWIDTETGTLWVMNGGTLASGQAPYDWQGIITTMQLALILQDDLYLPYLPDSSVLQSIPADYGDKYTLTREGREYTIDLFSRGAKTTIRIRLEGILVMLPEGLS